MIIKVCGMRDERNIREVARLGVQWLGFIFYPRSPRYVEPGELARLDLRSAKNALKYGFGVHGSADTIPESAVKEICPGFPPVFFLHSDADNLSFSQTAQLRSALKRAEVKYSEYRAAYRNVKRDFYLDAGSRPEADSALAAAARFADKCLNNELRIDEYTEI